MAAWIKINKDKVTLDEIKQLFEKPTDKFDIHYFDGSKGNYYEMEIRGFEDGEERKAKKEFFKQLSALREKGENIKLSDLKQIEYNGKQYLAVYKAQQYRWENTADPKIDDVKYFIDENQAKVYAEEIQLTVGFESQVETRCLAISFLSEEDWDREFDDIEEIVEEYDFDDYEETQSIHYNEGKDITGGIVVEWNWEKYPGYCRNLTDIGIAGEGNFYSLKTEDNFITGNEERTYKTNYSLLLTKEEIKEFSKIYETEEMFSQLIYEKLYDSGWNWNDFSNNPNSKQIKDKISKVAFETTGIYVFVENVNGERKDISFHMKERNSNSIDINHMGYEGTLKTNVGRIECNNNYFEAIEAPRARYIHCENNENLEIIKAPNCIILTCEECPLLKEENIEITYDCDIKGLEQQKQLKR